MFLKTIIISVQLVQDPNRMFKFWAFTLSSFQKLSNEPFWQNPSRRRKKVDAEATAQSFSRKKNFGPESDGKKMEIFVAAAAGEVESLTFTLDFSDLSRLEPLKLMMLLLEPKNEPSCH